MKIVIISGASLTNNPRSLKEADALTEAGHDVIVFGSCFDERVWQLDRQLMSTRAWHFESLDLRSIGLQRRFNQWLWRVRRKLAILMFKYAGIQRPSLYAYGGEAILKMAQKEQADFVIGHNEIGLFLVTRLIREGKRVGFDFEDWHSQDLPASARNIKMREALRSLEKNVMNGAAHLTAASEPMSQSLFEEYGGKKPVAINNVFPLPVTEPVIDVLNQQILRVVWFSQTLGQGRGLEDVFGILRSIHPFFELHLLGKTVEQTRIWIQEQVPPSWRGNIYLHDPIASDALVPWLSQFDVGLALDSPDCRSRDVTITNKVFQYMMAGLGVVATSTTGNCWVLDQDPEIGELYKSGNLDGLAQILMRLSMNRSNLRHAQQAARKVTLDKYNWDLESRKLVDSITSVE